MTLKLFEDTINTTPECDSYATVASGCLTELMKKERIIDLLTNPMKIELIRKSGWFLSKPPQLPPLVTDQACFAFYIDGTLCKDARKLSSDDLRPWSAVKNSSDPSFVNIKPNVRRHPVARLDGNLKIVKMETGLADYFLTEYSARLPREERLHKKIFYLSQDNKVYGNVLILYNYVSPGPAPRPICSNAPQKKDIVRNPSIEAFLSPFSNQKCNSKELQPDQLLNSINSDHGDNMNLLSGNENVGISGNKDKMRIKIVPRVDNEINEIMDHENYHTQKGYYHQERLISMHPDTISGGFDSEFNKYSSEDAENPDAFYDKIRKLSTGHVYLTVRHKKEATSIENVLEWIANTNFVEQHGILNATKPAHPPLVTNSRAYGFFVSSAAVVQRLMTRDDLSPWSGSRTLENPNYRTKSRKYGVECQYGIFVLKDADFKLCSFHLVYLYSTNPREPRLKKKIYYLMEAQSKMIVSHALIIYDYQSDGDIPKLNFGKHMYKSKKEF